MFVPYQNLIEVQTYVASWYFYVSVELVIVFNSNDSFVLSILVAFHFG